jgi:hypothetical protein
MATKMIFSAKIKDDNGKEIIYPIEIEKDIPNIDEFLNGKNFATNFHNVETAILNARKELSERIVQEYLGESTKKKHLKK